MHKLIDGARPGTMLLLALLATAEAAPGPQPAGWPLEGNQAGAGYGAAVAGAGDVDGDGYGDLIVGAPGHDNGEADEGIARLYRGGPSGPATIPAWTAEGNESGAAFGSAAATAGDVNGDGYADVVVGSPGFGAGQGRAVLYLGGPAGLATTPAWVFAPTGTGAQVGAAVAAAGDVNGDGYSDVIVGAWQFSDPGTLEVEGRAFVFLGSSAGLATSPAWTGEGNQADARYGWSVGTAGDVNGDGYADVIIGAPGYGDGEAGEGRVLVYLGSAAGLAPAPAWTVESGQAGAALGTAVATAGDLDGDGFADVAVGLPQYDDLPATDNGRVRIYFGGPAGLPTTPGDEHIEIDAGARFGGALASAGDVNGDGCADLVVGAPGYSGIVSTAGGAYLFRGRCRGGQEADFDWVTSGLQQLSAYGAVVAAAGDLNGDGFADVVVGAPAYANGELGEGRVYVYLGEPGAEPPGFPPSNAWVSEGDQSGGAWGASVASAGDVNGDGYADLVVGAPLYDKGETDEGAAFLYLGSEAGLGPDAVPGTVPVWFVEGNQAGALLGSAVAGAGDVNGDGYDDVLVGASGYVNGGGPEGRATLYLGSPGGLAPAPAWISAGNDAGVQYGASLAGAGDVNGDGYADVVIGSPGFSGGEAGEGRAVMYLGGPAGPSTTAAWTVEGNAAGAAFGSAIASAGDVNGDGYADLIVGAPGFANGQPGEGRAQVYLGSAAGLAIAPGWTAESDQAGAAFGQAVAGAGDVNGDGYSDVIVGAPGFDNGGADSGDAAVFLGSATGLAPAADWNLQGSAQAPAQRIGHAVASAGDVNGDGYSDLLIGFPGRPLPGEGGAPDSGGAALYLGGPSGPGEAGTLIAGAAGARVGAAVAGAGDLNGDNLADYVIGIPAGQVYQATPAGVAFVAYRNSGTFAAGLPARQRRVDDSAPVALRGATGAVNGINLQVLARSPFGRGGVQLEYEVKPFGTPLDGTGLERAPAGWTDSGVAGVPLAAVVTALQPATGYHWRLRVKYRPATAPFQAHGPWLRPVAVGAEEQTFRTGGGVAPDTDGDGVPDTLDNCTLEANPEQCDTDGDGYGNRCDGDFNNNGFTNAQDTIFLRQQLGQPSVPPTYNEADLNCNEFVNAQDTTLFRTRLGVPSGPSGLVP